MKLRIRLFILFLAGLFSPILSEFSPKDVLLSGEFRFRHLYYQSESVVPSYLEGEGMKEVSYSDLFFRNRLNIQVLPGLLIGSVFDVYFVFGEDNGKISSPDIGFQIRNVFAELKLFNTAKLTGGFTTFTLPQGFVLATNGAGIKYEHSFANDLLVPYFNWIKAYDNSRDNLSSGIGLNNYKDNDVLIGGIKLNPSGSMETLELFYVYDHDAESKYDTVKYLHWIGAGSKFIFTNFNLDIMAIYNNGQILSGGNFELLSSVLFYLSLSYEKIFGQSKIKISGVVEAASGEPGSTYRHDQFMSINSSYGVSNISIDNYAGISLFKGGNFAGLANLTLIFDYYFDRVQARFIYSHLRLFNKFLLLDSNFGNETDINISYDFNKNIGLNIQTGIFWPDIAYHDFSGDPSQKPIFEITGGLTLKY